MTDADRAKRYRRLKYWREKAEAGGADLSTEYVVAEFADGAIALLKWDGDDFKNCGTYVLTPDA